MAEERIYTNKDLVFREEDEGAFLFDPKTGELNCLNHTGAIIWKICEKGAVKEDVIEGMRDGSSDVPIDTIKKDVENFLNTMKEAGLLVYREEDDV